jgi:hypothetical protein
MLHFASEDARSQKSKAKSASAIADLLYKWGVKNIVLNACNSASGLQPPTILLKALLKMVSLAL